MCLAKSSSINGKKIIWTVCLNVPKKKFERRRTVKENKIEMKQRIFKNDITDWQTAHKYIFKRKKKNLSVAAASLQTYTHIYIYIATDILPVIKTPVKYWDGKKENERIYQADGFVNDRCFFFIPLPDYESLLAYVAVYNILHASYSVRI